MKINNNGVIMSRTIRGSKPKGYDFNSKRCFGCVNLGCGKVAKQITKAKERTRKRLQLRKELRNL
tara:strand:- start:36690 stop:36884 length:195 start_codon:yes stop_codon:yes gene_type:complete